MSKSETMLWQRLRRNQIGFRFTRQLPVGPYVLDFCCRQAQLAVEVDGDLHDTVKDEIRDQFLTDHGFKVIRITTERLFYEMDTVVNWIWHECDQRVLGDGEDA